MKRKPTKATNITNRTSIHERPAEADGKRFGDWEMDLIVDGHNHAILVLLERSTNFVMMERLKHGKKAEPLAKAVIRMLFPYRKTIRSITTDNGSEFANHLAITKKLGVPFNFHQTGSYLIKDGRQFHIPREHQHSQARKAKADYHC